MLCIGKEGVIVMVKDGEIIDISQYRNTEQILEDMQREAIEGLIDFSYLEALDAIHLRINTLESRLKALEELAKIKTYLTKNEMHLLYEQLGKVLSNA
jgi:fumarylacetoacetate (FAA) hydrolase family protein